MPALELKYRWKNAKQRDIALGALNKHTPFLNRISFHAIGRHGPIQCTFAEGVEPGFRFRTKCATIASEALEQRITFE